MKTTPPDALSSEERELAALLTRTAPHGVPSPEIDARILAASRAEVRSGSAPSPKPRWQVPLGVAASMVLAVGLAWQLRPMPPAVGGPEPVPTGSAPSAQPAAVVQIPPPASPVAADEPVAELLPEPASGFASPPPALRALSPPVAPKPVRPAREVEMAEATIPRSLPSQPPPPPPAAPAPLAPPAAAPPVPPAGSTQPKLLGLTAAQRQEALRQSAASSAREADSAAEAAKASRRELRVAPISERVQDQASPGDGGPIRARRTDLKVPVAADAQLQVDEWLERVRTRYGLGDEEAARRSLILFVQDHPTEPVPGDLEPLLDE